MRYDCTEEFSGFREILQGVWNSGFADQRVSNRYEAHELFSIAAARLFDALILLPLGFKWRVQNIYKPGLAAPFLVSLNVSEANLSVNQYGVDEPCRIWGRPELVIRPGEFDLQFVSFFDWNESSRREFSILEVRIVGSREHQALVGRHALIELSKCSIWVDLEEWSDNNR